MPKLPGKNSPGSAIGLFPGGLTEKVAAGDELEWIDDGPPSTLSHPTSSQRRFYTVEEQ